MEIRQETSSSQVASKIPLRSKSPLRNKQFFTFASESVQKKRNRADGKVQELKMQRDLRGRIRAIALENKVDIKQV